MGKEIDFDFCIIPNPFASGGRNMIFITKSGEKSLDKDVVKSKKYKDVKEILEKFGYTETDFLQFESSNNESMPKSTIMEMKEFLEGCGLSYSRDLEVNVVKDLNSIKENNFDFSYKSFEEGESPMNEKTRNELIESKGELFKFKHIEPELNEKITLNFYLFLEFGFNQIGTPIIQFGGDFKDNDDYDDRNYIKIVESDFVRIHDPNSPNSIVLKSDKTQGDLIKEVGILYKGYFKYQKRFEKDDSMILKETTFRYRLAEVRKHLNPDQSIIVETNRMGYDRLVKLSDKIKAERIQEANEFISTNEIKNEAEELSQFLSNKMIALSEGDEFEEASKLKKDVELINEKIELVKKLDKSQITTEEYFDLFSIS